ncbi:MAG: hypothetical protein HN826_15200 [Methylococcales bacterium]|jgi:hypothetical protein|nr:hypothetical protein [Methylococcales bacterium]
MKKIIQYPLQILNYSVFMGIVWFFSIHPSYHQLDKNQAMITFTMSHIGKHVTKCKKISYKELMKLPPNMRKPMDCPRERSPVEIELMLDSKVVYSRVVQPVGLFKDQGVDIYENIRVSAGKHRFKVWINDDVNVKGPIYRHEQDLTIRPEQHLVIQFKSKENIFSVR